MNPESDDWIQRLDTLASTDPRGALDDPRLGLLGLRPGVFRKAEALRALIAFVVHPYDSLRGLALQEARVHDVERVVGWSLGPEAPWAWATDPRLSAAVTVRMAIHASAPTDTLLELLEDAREKVWTAILERTSLPSAVREAALTHPDAARRAAYAARPSIAPTEAVTLARDVDEGVRKVIARRVAQFGQEVLEVLAVDSSLAVRKLTVASLEQLEREHVEAFRLDDDVSVRVAVAQKITDGSLLTRFVDDPSDEVRVVAARSSVIEVDDRRKLVRDTSSLVRAAVISNAQISESELLAIHPDVDVGTACSLAVSRNAPRESLLTLAEHDDVDVLTCVAAHPRLPPRLTKTCLNRIRARGRRKHSKDPIVVAARVKAASWPVLDDDVLSYLLRDPSMKVRAACATRADLDEARIVQLARDPAVTVRRQVANRRGLSHEVQAILVNDSDERVWKRFDRAFGSFRRRNDSTT